MTVISVSYLSSASILSFMKHSVTIGRLESKLPNPGTALPFLDPDLEDAEEDAKGST